jgi:hypothetical protein
VAVGSTALVCGRLIVGIKGYNPAEGMDVSLWCLLCVGSRLWDEMITRLEECVCLCVCVCVPNFV